MADLYSDPVAINTRKTLPSHNFGGRQFRFYTFVTPAGALVDPLDANAWKYTNSVYSRSVRAIQGLANQELFWLGEPKNDVDGWYDAPEDSDAFTFAVAESNRLETTYNDLSFNNIGDVQVDDDPEQWIAYDLTWAIWADIPELSCGSAVWRCQDSAGIFPIFVDYTPPISDRRLKRNIELLETRNGVKIYSFQYLWSDQYFVGVMAQDLLGTEHESAVIERNGYYTVDYRQLGFNMQLLSEYNALTV